jgi:hypothetical protein
MEQSTMICGLKSMAAVLGGAVLMTTVGCTVAPAPYYETYGGTGYYPRVYRPGTIYTPQTTYTPPVYQQTPVPEPPAPAVQPGNPYALIPSAQAGTTRPEPPPPQPPPIDTSDCTGWWRICHFYQ